MTRHIEALDGFRGLAILFVLLGHSGIGLFEQFGPIGVQMFFALSGFLISRILLSSIESPVYYRVFYARRALRIFPAYYLLFIVVTVSALFLLWPVKMPHVFLFYLQTFLFSTKSHPENFANGYLLHTWSLSVEEMFYLAWPFLVRLAGSRKLAWLSGFLVLLSIALRAVILNFWPGKIDLTYTHLFTNLDFLCSGALVACVFASNQGEGRFWKTGSVIFALSLIVYPLVAWLSGLRIVMLSPGFRTSQAEGQVFMVFLVIALVGALLYTADAPETHSVTRLLRARALVYVGRISYGLYLFHWPVFRMLDAMLGESHVWMIPLRIFATFAIASLSWAFFEGPILALKDRITLRLTQGVLSKPT